MIGWTGIPVWMETFGAWGLVPIVGVLIFAAFVALCAKGKER